jgi:hypothetical protein
MNRIYLDTSVYGGFFEPEFEIWSKILFDKINSGFYSVIFSKLTEIELERAPHHVKSLALSIQPSQIDIIDISDEALELAEIYLKEGVVGKTSKSDCIHIALATLFRADVLVSWNFKHIVNVHRIRGYNSINYRLGHPILEIRSPREIIEI